MKKYILSGIVACSFGLAFAGNQIITAPHLTSDSDAFTPSSSIFFQGGVMYESTKDVVGVADVGCPSMLYGGVLGVRYDLIKTDLITHSISFSAGYYSGDRSSSFDVWHNNPNDAKGNKTLDVDVIPLFFSYDAKAEITGSVSGFFGIRAGAMIRNTELNGRRKGSTYLESDNGDINRVEYDVEWNGVDSSKIRSMVGFGFGIESYLSQNVKLSVSTDFMWTMGKIDANSGFSSNDNGPIEVTTSGIGKRGRFHALFNVGLTYTF